MDTPTLPVNAGSIINLQLQRLGVVRRNHHETGKLLQISGRSADQRELVMFAVIPYKTRVSARARAKGLWLFMVEIVILGYPEMINPIQRRLVFVTAGSRSSLLDLIPYHWPARLMQVAQVQNTAQMGLAKPIFLGDASLRDPPAFSKCVFKICMCMFMSFQLAAIENVATILVWDIHYLLGSFQTKSMQPS